MADQDLATLFTQAHALQQPQRAEFPLVVGDKTIPCPTMIMPTGMAMHSIKKVLDEYRPHPERRRSNLTVEDQTSFNLMTIRNKTPNTVVLASREPPRIVAVLDYHAEGGDGAPGWCEDRITYEPETSDEWGAWSAVVGKTFTVPEFAAFIEDHVMDLYDPASAGGIARDAAQRMRVEMATPARVMDLSRGMTVRANQVASQAVNLSTGEGEIRFDQRNENVDGTPLKVPGAFLIQIPVFRGGPLYQILVRLRYRVKEGRISWSIDPYRMDVCLEDAFKEILTTVATTTAVPVVRGAFGAKGY